MTRSVLAYLPLGLWAAAALLVGTVDFGLSPLPAGSDKAGHFLMYGLGGALAAWAGRKRGRAAAGWGGLAVVLLTGVADELHQSTVPFRDSELLDWVADATGALLLFLIVDRLLKKD